MARARMDVMVGGVIAIGVSAIAFTKAKDLHAENDSNHVMLLGLAAGMFLAGLWVVWRHAIANGATSIARLAFLTLAALGTYGVLAWSWLEDRTLRQEIGVACVKDQIERLGWALDAEDAWLATMADHAVEREKRNIGVGDAAAIAHFRFWAPDGRWIADAPKPLPPWLGRFPVPNEIAATRAAAKFPNATLNRGTREDIDVEPWRTLAFPAAALARTSPRGTTVMNLHQFRYVSVGEGENARAILASVFDPRGSGELKVVWFELSLRMSAGSWDVIRGEMQIATLPI